MIASLPVKEGVVQTCHSGLLTVFIYSAMVQVVCHVLMAEGLDAVYALVFYLVVIVRVIV